jgi:diguanylate cyclase (GGDEF)-like protein
MDFVLLDKRYYKSLAILLFCFTGSFFLYLFPKYSHILLSFIFLGTLLSFILYILNRNWTRKTLLGLSTDLEAIDMKFSNRDYFYKKLMMSGDKLLGALERETLLNNIREAFITYIKVPAGYLLVFNQNRNVYEFQNGISFNKLKLISPEIPSNGNLLSKILNHPSSVLFHDLSLLKKTNDLHFDKKVLERIVPEPEIMVSIRMKMQDVVLGVQFLLLSRTQAEDIEAHMLVFQSLVNQTTLALGTAVQREFAIKDRMTMLYNHEYFMSRLKDEIGICERSKDSQFTLLMMDIDHFKKFNDTYGHQVGDQVLIETTKIYVACVRKDFDLVARYGGEEFAILLHQTGLKNGVAIAEKIRSSIEESIFLPEEKKLKVTVSIGVSEWKGNLEKKMTPKSMVKQADDKLYECKNKGRNQVCY